MKRRPIDRRAFCLGGLAAAAGLGLAPRPAPGGIQLGVNGSLGGVRPFPDADPWNRNVARDPVDPNSEALLRGIGLDKPLHPDFGTTYNGRPIGIPYVVVPGGQPRVPVKFVDSPLESDAGPYPIPPDVPIEGGAAAPAETDRHLIVVDRDAWKLYEVFHAFRDDAGWRGGAGAIFDLANNTNRPFEWTSADAAGLPIFPGLVRHDEAAEGGAIRHALRFTCSRVRRAYVHPARHWSNRLTDPKLPPFGMRVRLRRGFDVRGFPPVAQVILQALKDYGMFLADIGSDWYITGTHDPRWDDEALGTLRRVRGRDLEVLKLGPIAAG